MITSHMPVTYGMRPHPAAVLCAGCRGWINGAVSYYLNNYGPYCPRCHALEQEPVQTSEAEKARLAEVLGHLLARNGVVQGVALEDPEGYDQYATVNGVAKASDEFVQYLKTRKCSL